LVDPQTRAVVEVVE